MIRVQDPPNTSSSNAEIFVDLMGAPLQLYVQADIPDRDALLELITKHGGSIASGYVYASYILVDPMSDTGQSLYRQYFGRKGKVVLGWRWAEECAKKSQLLTYAADWGSFKVNGTERTAAAARQPSPNQRRSPVAESQPNVSHGTTTIHSQPASAAAHLASQRDQQASWNGATRNVPPLTEPRNPYPPQGYRIRTLEERDAEEATRTQASSSITAQTPPTRHPLQTNPASNPSYNQTWDPPRQIPPYQFSYTGEHWIPPPDFYEPPFNSFEPIPQESSDASAGPSVETEGEARGRKRRRTESRKSFKQTGPPRPLITPRVVTRSPTPPSRVVPTSHGGHMFTAEDIMYLAKYIEYCQTQGLILSLREICERLAIKAPHHTYHSWRRYCNKNNIRLGAYKMDPRPTTDEDEEQDLNEQELQGAESGREKPAPSESQGPIITTFSRSERPYSQYDGSTRQEIIPPSSSQTASPRRNRSPTPPANLFKSTTGKGVAFTEEDTSFLMKLLQRRRTQATQGSGEVDMVQFWKEVAEKAPHHSRASWMKFWQRHRHELDGPDPEPAYVPPAKKMRYSKEDDTLLAKLFAGAPEGTSDAIFQMFAKEHPHHPWKGWQEHHRIHKKRIDILIEQLVSSTDP